MPMKALSERKMSILYLPRGTKQGIRLLLGFLSRPEPTVMSAQDKSHLVSFVVFSKLVATVASVHFYGEDSIFPVLGRFGHFAI